MNLISKNYVFENKNESLKFIGNFEEYYKNEKDPWGQSGTDDRLKEYYLYSRKNLVDNIKKLENINNVLEIGCGHGYVSDFIQKNTNLDITGMDISKTAIKKCKDIFYNCEFIVGDICDPTLSISQKYDVVMLCEILWYILHDLNIAFNNINKLLKNNGYVIINQGFLKDQKYGKDKIDGFNGLNKFVLSNYFYKLIKSEILYNKFLLDNGIIILKKEQFL